MDEDDDDRSDAADALARLAADAGRPARPERPEGYAAPPVPPIVPRVRPAAPAARAASSASRPVLEPIDVSTVTEEEALAAIRAPDVDVPEAPRRAPASSGVAPFAPRATLPSARRVDGVVALYRALIPSALVLGVTLPLAAGAYRFAIDPDAAARAAGPAVGWALLAFGALFALAAGWMMRRVRVLRPRHPR